MASACSLTHELAKSVAGLLKETCLTHGSMGTFSQRCLLARIARALESPGPVDLHPHALRRHLREVDGGGLEGRERLADLAQVRPRRNPEIDRSRSGAVARRP